MLVKPFCKLFRWNVVLSRNRITFRFPKSILQSNLTRTVSMISLFIHALLFEIQWTDIGFDGSLRDLKHRGTFDHQITTGSETKEPSAATINMAVFRCLDFFCLYFAFSFSANPFSGKALRNSPSSSRFSILCGSYPWQNSGNRSIQTSIVVVETSSASPLNLFYWTL